MSISALLPSSTGHLITLSIVLLVGCSESGVSQDCEVLCPARKVCDGHGGCVFREQLASCAGAPDGTACSYVADRAITGMCMVEQCIEVRCGNGLRTPDEVCDDGNTDNGDGCSADCQSDETCGNGIVDPTTEQCDDGNAIDEDSCRNSCMVPVCGDGVRDPGEACDDGALNSDMPNALCRTSCKAAGCGDGIIDDAHELCDDGNNLNLDGCSADCASDERCGNGIVDTLLGEECDDGNTSDGDACHHDCKIPVCGDGIKDPGEECDGLDTGGATCGASGTRVRCNMKPYDGLYPFLSPCMLDYSNCLGTL